MTFATIDDGGGGTDSASGSTTTTTTDTSTDTTESSYDLDEVATGTTGGHATSDPTIVPSAPDSETETTEQGGEHTYDIDDSVADDPALSYSSINDPRQTAEDTTGTAGGEVENTVIPNTGWGGGIAGGLDPSGADSDGDGISDSEEEQIDAIADATHTTDEDGNRIHTTDTIPDNPGYVLFDDGDPSTDSGSWTEPDWDGDGEPGGNLTDRDVNLPDVPDVGGFLDNLENSLVVLLVLAVVAFLVVREMEASNA